jgi:hypothetical protein
MTAFQALEWTSRLTAFCVLLDVLETFYNYKSFTTTGLYNWIWLRQSRRFAHQRPVFRKMTDAIFSTRVWFYMVALRGFAAFFLMIQPLPFFCLWILFFTGGLTNFRVQAFGAETQNRFTMMMITALCLYSCVPTVLVVETCLYFLAAQACLSYATAGFYKLLDKDWREGRGLFYVVNTPIWVTSSTMAHFFNQHTFFNKLFSWLIIGFECTFPLILVMEKPYGFIFIGIGILFHALNAIILGLNKFFWAWIATYPAIIYLLLR